MVCEDDPVFTQEIKNNTKKSIFKMGFDFNQMINVGPQEKYLHLLQNLRTASKF